MLQFARAQPPPRPPGVQLRPFRGGTLSNEWLSRQGFPVVDVGAGSPALEPRAAEAVATAPWSYQSVTAVARIRRLIRCARNHPSALVTANVRTTPVGVRAVVPQLAVVFDFYRSVECFP